MPTCILLLFIPFCAPVGTARVYDSSFDLVADLALAGANVSSFVNDVIVTKTAAYITDSFNRNLYKVRI